MAVDLIWAWKSAEPRRLDATVAELTGVEMYKVPVHLPIRAPTTKQIAEAHRKKHFIKVKFAHWRTECKTAEWANFPLKPNQSECQNITPRQPNPRPLATLSATNAQR
jgi:hypothetical protein